MQNRFIVVFEFNFNIEYVYQDIEIKLNVLVLYDKTESARGFFMHLTMMTVLDQMFNKALIDVIVSRSIEYLI